MPRTLKDYNAKRDFGGTPEPEGSIKDTGGRLYVIQSHDASRHHFDFRLELDGVLLSWAIPKGPSLDPSEKRLAVRTEDHPVDYGAFEGVIPEGYGAGTVMLWDRGDWAPAGDPEKGLKNGELKFRLNGARLKGGWALIRMKPKKGEKNENWLLVKERDDHADPDTDPTRRWTTSVRSRRAMKTIADEDGNGEDDAMELDGVHLTSPDKVLYPEQGATKRRIAEYYVWNAERILTFVKDRPLTVVRCPDGRADDCFFQKHHTDSTPGEIGKVEIEERSGKKADHLTIHDRRGLVAAAQIAALELHVWGARKDRIERPERIVFDLDPDEDLDFAAVRRAARELRDVLGNAGLDSWPLLTGGKGIHVVVPIERRRGWDDVKTFASGLARRLAEAAPDRYVAQASKSKRKGRVFIDWLRNERGATAIAPYSLRARTGAPVATPVGWDELGRIERADRYNLDNIRARLERLKSDPWAGYHEVRQSITNGHLAFAEGRTD